MHPLWDKHDKEESDMPNLSDLKKPIVIAHRGYRVKSPENTLAAFKAAVDCGVRMIELDITLTKDREIIVIHDDTLERTTNGTGSVRNHTLSELKMLDAGSWFDPAFNGERLPTLKEVFNLIDKHIFINIEIKRTAYEPDNPPDSIETQVIELVRSKNLIEQVLVSSFEPNILININERDKGIPVSFLSQNKADKKTVTFCKQYNMFSWNPDFRILTPGQVTMMHSENINVIPYTVNTIKDAERLIEMGVDGVFTDDPALIMQYFFFNEK